MNSGSAIIICWKDKVLLFHRDDKPLLFPDHWQLPGGGVEKGETPLGGLKRELIEEVSHVPKNIKFSGRAKREGGVTYLYTAFVDEDEAKKFRIGKTEGQEIGFFTLNKALKLKLTPVLRARIMKFRKEIEKALREKSFSKVDFNSISRQI